MNYTVEQFNGIVDEHMAAFFEKAAARGFVNNASLEMLNSCADERKHVIFLIKDGVNIVGTFGAHTIDILPNAYRICVRTCVLTDNTGFMGLTTLNHIKTHSNLIAQFAIPACIAWVNDSSANMYISSHPSPVGTQRLVHNIYCPTLEKIGVLLNTGEHKYRGHEQTFWKLNAGEFTRQLAAHTEYRYPGAISFDK